MDTMARDKWQRFVDRFDLRKPGAKPWDANLLARSCEGASHGEKCTAYFLLYVWNPCDDTPWAGRFRLEESLQAWDGNNRQVFSEWTANPFWP